MRRANVMDTELDEPLDAAGFRHQGTPLGRKLGGSRIGAGLYVADPGVPIWPYHYHWGTEEWLWVIAGAPVLREPTGERRLGAGDLVVFPSGPAGSHTVSGPGRFVIFSTAHAAPPWMTTYVDSDKVSGPEGILLRSSRVGYWHNEGTHGPEAPGEWIDPPAGPPRPVVNLGHVTLELETAAPAGARRRRYRLGPLLGAEMLGATLYELAPGEASGRYHYEHGREEWAVVLSGAPTLRHAEGEETLAVGDAVCFPEGPSGAHHFSNSGPIPARFLMISTMEPFAPVVYPDSGTVMMRGLPDGPQVFRFEDAVGGWE